MSDLRLDRIGECDVTIDWSGKGLPPVGTICEANIPEIAHCMPGVAGYAWRKVEVCKSGMPGAEGECLVYDLETTAPCWADEFRPLRTLERIECAEQKAAVAAMVEIMERALGFVTADTAVERERLEVVAQQLYMDGYVKKPKLDLKPGGLARIVFSKNPANMGRVVQLIEATSEREICMPNRVFIGNPEGKRCWIVKATGLHLQRTDNNALRISDYACIGEARLEPVEAGNE